MDEIQKELMEEGQDGINIILYFESKIYIVNNFWQLLICIHLDFRVICINVIQCRVKELYIQQTLQIASQGLKLRFPGGCHCN